MTEIPLEASTLGDGFAVLAFDVGGTDIKAGLVDEAGRMLGITRVPTPLHGGETADAVLKEVAQLAAGLARDFPGVTPRAAGLIAPGLVDDERGVGIRAVNLSWSNVPFKQLLEQRLKLPASFSHDVRAAGTAEFLLGAAQPFHDVVIVVIGTGIASAVFIDGRAHRADGYAGELGHSIIDPHGELCACGARGCLETVASAGAIVRRYQQRTGHRPNGAKDVLQRAQNGDAAATLVWNEALDALALAIAQLAAVLAPEAIIIGGGLAQAGDALFRPLRGRVDALLSFHRRPTILPAFLGDNAGLLGAALAARRVSPGTTRPNPAAPPPSRAGYESRNENS